MQLAACSWDASEVQASACSAVTAVHAQQLKHWCRPHGHAEQLGTAAGAARRGRARSLLCGHSIEAWHSYVPQQQDRSKPAAMHLQSAARGSRQAAHAGQWAPWEAPG